MKDPTAAERMRRYRKWLKEGIVDRKKERLIAAGVLQPADRDNDAAMRAAEDKFWAKGPVNSAADAVFDPISGEIGEKNGVLVKNPAVEPVKAPSRPPTKAEALLAYREMLGGAELPNDLVRAAHAADLEAAQASLQRFVDDAERGQGYEWARIRSKWRQLQCDPGRLAVEYGIPLLELAIRNRQQAEADAARPARLAKGLTIPIKLLAQTICGLPKRFPRRRLRGSCGARSRGAAGS